MKFSEIVFLGCVLGVLGAMAVPVRDTISGASRRSLDASNIRQIGQASLIYAKDHREKLPPRFGLNEDGLVVGEDITPSIHALAAALALSGGLNDSQMWMAEADKSRLLRRDATMVLEPAGGAVWSIHPGFRGSGVSFQYIAGLTTAMPSTTPIAVTRGLDVDGHWVESREESVYGSVGGYVVYLGGNVSFKGGAPTITWWDRLQGKKQPPGKAADFIDTQGSVSNNILETITDRQGIYSFPETPTGKKDGLAGIGKPWPKSPGGGSR